MDTWMTIGMTVVAAVVAVSIFNSVVGKKNQVEFAFASIDAQLKKRFDLIPNLVASCEKYMGYEETLLKDLAQTRMKMLQARADDTIALDIKLSSQLRSVFALAENYPDLKAVETFTLLQRSLNEVEEQLAAARRAFNAAVTVYNNAVQMFPTSVAAKLMGYQSRTWFEAEQEERQQVKAWRT